MGSYEIMAPCAYVQDGWLVRQRKPGVTVEIDDATAATLGASVRPAGAVAEPASVAAPEPAPKPPPQPAPENPAEGTTGPADAS